MGSDASVPDLCILFTFHTFCALWLVKDKTQTIMTKHHIIYGDTRLDQDIKLKKISHDQKLAHSELKSCRRKQIDRSLGKIR